MVKNTIAVPKFNREKLKKTNYRGQSVDEPCFPAIF